MRVLALDLSKQSAGWACFSPGDKQAASGWWQLGSTMTSRGMTFRHLYQQLNALHSLGKIHALFYERPLDLDALSQGKLKTNAETVKVLNGLAMHAESWAEAAGCRIIRDVHQSSWRSHFLKGMTRPPEDRRAKDYLKDMAVQRAKSLGFRVERHDQAEAIGVLDYAHMALDLPAPWRAHEQLDLRSAG